MRGLAVAVALTALSIGGATAQVSVGPNGVRSNGTIIDSTGVHTPGVDVTNAGIHSRSPAGGVVVRTNGGRRSIDCIGGSLRVDGNRNTFNVVRCARVTINGNSNVVSARFARAGQMSVMGNRNQVTVSSPAMVRVGVSNLGTRNSVSRRRA
jgi:hypothetical protein